VNKRGGVFVLGLLLCTIIARAQSPTAVVNGQVRDSSGAAIPKATVIVINDATNVHYTTETNDEGIYSVPNLPPGTYRIQVSKQGFKTTVHPDIVLHVQDAEAIGFTLPVGPTSDTVTVEGGAPLVNTQDASVGTVIDRNFVENVPLNGRSFNTLLQLTPGAVIAPSNSTSPGQFSINGQRTNGNYFQVDGVSANFGTGAPAANGLTYQGGAGGSQAFNVYGGTSSLVSVDALQEFRVETSSFAPEFGHTPGGQVAIETRSGTNSFHGGVFEYFRNTVLDANDWFNNAATPQVARTPEKQNDFGGFLGGPIVADKTFFFASYEGLHLLQPQTQVQSVPSSQARTEAVAAAAPYIDAFPQPNGPVSPTNPYLAQFTGAYDNKITTNAGSLRIDQKVGENWGIFGRFNYAPSRELARGHVQSELDSIDVNTTTLTLGVTGLLAQNLTNSFRTNYSVQTNNETATLDSFDGAIPPDSRLLLPSPFSTGNGKAAFFFLGLPIYQTGRDYGVRTNQIEFADAIAYAHGRHQLKFGVDYLGLHFAESGIPAQLVYVSLSLKNFTTNPSAFQLGGTTQNAAKIRFSNFAGFAEDTWRLGQRVSLTYGLRWEYNPPPSPLDGTILSAWENTDNPKQTVLAPIGTSPWKSTYDNFAPRAGIAYNVSGKGDFVIRAGWGIFYDLGTGIASNLAAAFPNLVSKTSLFVPLPVANASQYLPTLSLQSPYPAGNYYGFSQNLRSPRSYQWNVALEKSFAGSQSVSMTYVGQIGRDLLRTVLEESPNNNFASNSFLDLTLNGDTSNYNALQLQYRRPLSHNVQALLNYTWSRCIDTSSSDSAPVLPGSVAAAEGDRGSCDFDVRHNFTGAVTYSLPRLTKLPILAHVVNNWSVDTVLQARSGFPIDVTFENFSFPGLAQGIPSRPDLISKAIWLHGSQYPGGKALNPNAFDSTAPSNEARQGTLGRNAIAGFGATQIDLSVMRKFPLTERVNLQLRSDMFNILNHPNFSPPDGTLTDDTFGVSRAMLNKGLGGLSPLYQIGGPRSVQLSLKLIF
jgi:hypothetical protein